MLFAELYQQIYGDGMGGNNLGVRSLRCNHPEAIANILVRILEKTPTGIKLIRAGGLFGESKL